MVNELELILREWKIEISFGEYEKFKQNIAGVLERTGFIREEFNGNLKYWENVEIGRLRLYATNRHTGCGTETLYLSLKSPSLIEGVPPVVSLIEQAIYSQKWLSLTIKRDPICA